MIIKLTENIYYMPHNEETDRPILGYILGNHFSLMVDAGNSKKHAELFIDEISKIGLPYPKIVAITHYHWDHTYGMCGLNSLSIACSKTNEYLDKMTKWEWNDRAMGQRLQNGEDIEFCHTHIRKEYPDLSQIVVKTADIIFEDKLLLNLGDLSCELIRLDSSHADDCVVVYIPEEKIIFIGDIISEDFHHGEPVYYKDKLNSLINNLKPLDFETALFGHMEPFTKNNLIQWLEEVPKEIIK